MQIRSQHASPRRNRLARVATPAVSLVLAAGMVGVWACAPRTAPSAAPAPAAAPMSAGFLPAASAAPAAAPAAAPSAEQLRAIEERVRAQVMAEVRAERSRASSVVVRDRIEMSSTAYCLKGMMRTGVRTRDGMAAGDPRVLPLGSVVRVSHPDGRPIGTFVVMDTGGAIRGNKIDIYMDSCREASAWGRRPVVTEVLEIGRS